MQDAGYARWGGSLWPGYAAWADYFNEVLSISIDRNYLDLVESCGYFWTLDDVCFASERPSTLNLDARGRLHSATGQSIGYPSGWGFWHWHGVQVPQDVIERPGELTATRIESEQNAEVRRAMIERFGLPRYIKDSGANVIQELPDNYFIKGLQGARLLRKELAGDEPIVMIDCLNSTPEPDGTTKRYLLRIDPNAYHGRAARECHAAMASTYRLPDGALAFQRPEDYSPRFES